MNPDDELLASLPSHDVDPKASERIRLRAHSMLRDRARRQRHSTAFRLSDCYHRFVEPAALIALALSYVAFTVKDTLALFN